MQSSSLIVSFENKEIFEQQLNEEKNNKVFRSLFCDEDLPKKEIKFQPFEQDEKVEIQNI